MLDIALKEWAVVCDLMLEGRLATKALDNRASVAVMLGALGYLSTMVRNRLLDEPQRR